MAGYDAYNPFAGYQPPTSMVDSGAYRASTGGGGGGMDPYSTGINALTALTGMISGSGLREKQKQMAGYQRQIAEKQRDLFASAAPQYQSALEHYANMIGMSNSEGLNGYSNSVGVSPHQAGRLGIDPNTQFQTGAGPNASNGYMMGPYDQQAFRLRSAAAEQNLQHQMQGADQNLMYQTRMMGLNSGATAAALAREHQNALQQYGDYQRNLAINAGTQEQQNLQNYLAMLGPGMGQAGQASAGFNTLNQQYGQQANQAYAGVGQALAGIGRQFGQQNPPTYGGYNPYDPYSANPYAQSLMGSGAQGSQFGY